MRKKLVQIGRSRGIRLSKAVLKKARITDELELEIEAGRIVLMRPGWRPREGWAESIAAIGPDNEDQSDWDNMKNEFDDTEWTWPEDVKRPNQPIVFASPSRPATPSKVPKSPKPYPVSSSCRTHRRKS